MECKQVSKAICGKEIGKHTNESNPIKLSRETI